MAEEAEADKVFADQLPEANMDTDVMNDNPVEEIKHMINGQADESKEMQHNRQQKMLNDQKTTLVHEENKKEISDFDAEFQAMLQESTSQAKQGTHDVNK